MKIRVRTIITLLLGISIASTKAAVPLSSSTRPFIWASMAERDAILDKIDNYSWAASLKDDLIGRVQSNLNSYESNKDAYLRALPIDWSRFYPRYYLTEEEVKSERFSYRLLFTKVTAKRVGQADRVIEFLSPNDPLARDIQKEYWVKEDREKPKFSASQVIEKIQTAGFKSFRMHQHILFWQKHDGKNPDRGFGAKVVKAWYWYQSWIDFIISELGKEAIAEKQNVNN